MEKRMVVDADILYNGGSGSIELIIRGCGCCESVICFTPEEGKDYREKAIKRLKEENERYTKLVDEWIKKIESI